MGRLREASWDTKRWTLDGRCRDWTSRGNLIKYCLRTSGFVNASDVIMLEYLQRMYVLNMFLEVDLLDGVGETTVFVPVTETIMEKRK